MFCIFSVLLAVLCLLDKQKVRSCLLIPLSIVSLPPPLLPPLSLLSQQEDQRSDSLKEHLMEELDYSLIPEPAWDKLVTWYGISETSRPIARYSNTEEFSSTTSKSHHISLLHTSHHVSLLPTSHHISLLHTSHHVSLLPKSHHISLLPTSLCAGEWWSMVCT